MNFLNVLFDPNVQIVKTEFASTFTSPTHFFFLYEQELCLLSDVQGNCWASRIEGEGMEGYFFINPSFMPPEVCQAIKTGNFVFKSFTEIYNMAVESFSPFVVSHYKITYISKRLKDSKPFPN